MIVTRHFVDLVDIHPHGAQHQQDEKGGQKRDRNGNPTHRITIVQNKSRAKHGSDIAAARAQHAGDILAVRRFRREVFNRFC